MAGPFLKWAGGKSRLAPLVVARAPARFRRYHEPFVGGGAVFFAMAGRAGGAVINDANRDLAECYGVVRDHGEALVRLLSEIDRTYKQLDATGRKSFYYGQRGTSPTTATERAARLLFLNHTCYNGLYRVNSRGEFNVPYGRYANPRICDADGLRDASLALSDVEILCEDFEIACGRATGGDFVYLDPPYQPLSVTARFTSYTAGNFGPADQERLRDAFEAMTRRGVAAMLSNSDHPAIRDLYDGAGYRFEGVAMSRAINSVGAKRSPVPELLISNFDRGEVRQALLPLAEARIQDVAESVAEDVEAEDGCADEEPGVDGESRGGTHVLAPLHRKHLPP